MARCWMRRSTALPLLVVVSSSFGWEASVTAGVVWIPVGTNDPSEMVGVRGELGTGTSFGSPQVLAQDGPAADFAASEARNAARKTFTFKLAVPMIEVGVVSAARTSNGRADRGFALRDGLSFGVGERSELFFGYELMLGYRAAGLGLLAGALGEYAFMPSRGDEGWRYRAQARVEIPCPWTRVPFQVNLRWDPRSDGAIGVQGVVPIGWTFAVYGGFQRTTSIAVYEEGGRVSTASVRGQQILFGIAVDMFEHFHVRRPPSP